MRQDCQAAYVYRNEAGEYALVRAPWAASSDLEACGEPAVDHHDVGSPGEPPIRTHLCAKHWDQYCREAADDGDAREAGPGPDGPPPGPEAQPEGEEEAGAAR